MAFDLESKCFEAFGFSLLLRGKNRLFHHDRLSIMPLWSRAQSAVRGFGDKPSGEGVGELRGISLRRSRIYNYWITYKLHNNLIVVIVLKLRY